MEASLVQVEQVAELTGQLLYSFQPHRLQHRRVDVRLDHGLIIQAESAVGFLGASAQSVDARHPTANDANWTSRWREPGSWMAPTKAVEIGPPEVVVIRVAADTGSTG